MAPRLRVASDRSASQPRRRRDSSLLIDPRPSRGVRPRLVSSDRSASRPRRLVSAEHPPPALRRDPSPRNVHGASPRRRRVRGDRIRDLVVSATVSARREDEATRARPRSTGGPCPAPASCGRSLLQPAPRARGGPRRRAPCGLPGLPRPTCAGTGCSGPRPTLHTKTLPEKPPRRFGCRPAPPTARAPPLGLVSSPPRRRRAATARRLGVCSSATATSPRRPRGRGPPERPRRRRS